MLIGAKRWYLVMPAFADCYNFSNSFLFAAQEILPLVLSSINWISLNLIIITIIQNGGCRLVDQLILLSMQS